MRIGLTWALLGMVVAAVGCKDDTKAAPEASASAVASAPAAPSSVAAAPSASAAPEVQHDCPAGSTGLGSAAKPCEAKGSSRMLQVSWNGKNDESGAPFFRVVNKSSKAILYGRVAVYFYDAKGKQIDAKEPIEGSDKTHAFHMCGGKLFAGVIQPAEKSTYTFSCVKKANVPDGTKAIEAEATEVGFADADGKKTDFYWKNADLIPEARPKGGVK